MREFEITNVDCTYNIDIRHIIVQCFIWDHL